MKLASALLALAVVLSAPARADDTSELFAKKCAGCHGGDGMGHTKLAEKPGVKLPDFTGAKWQKETTAKEIVEAIADGVKDTKMPAWKEKVSAEQMAGLAKYLRTLAKK